MRGISLCLVALAFATQDPASRPASRASRPAIVAASPLAGFWELRAFVGPNPAAAARFRGYLAIGQHHLSLHLLGPGPNPAIPFFQSGFRTYRIDHDRLITTVLIGASNKENGDVVIENTPLEEVRGFERVGSILRIKKSAGEYLDFVKIE